MSKKACNKENILAADKERDFERVVQNHPKWLRQEKRQRQPSQGDLPNHA